MEEYYLFFISVTMKTLPEECEDNQLDTPHEVNIFHSHCEQCIKVTKCIVIPTPNESCAVVTCELSCGFRFHACKLSEHRLLCANEKVCCINADYGCPVVLVRSQRAQHLETCPASVVVCTMEWNRWPMCSQERQMHIPFHVPNPQAKQGQLDVALALRDQRMLNNWLKVPYRTRRVLRNSLTRLFPAVPLQVHPESANDSIGLDETADLCRNVTGEENEKSSEGFQNDIYNAAIDRIDATIPDLTSSFSTWNVGCSDEPYMFEPHEKFVCGAANRVPLKELNGSTERRIMSNDTKTLSNVSEKNDVSDSQHLNKDMCNTKCEMVLNTDHISIIANSCKSKDDYNMLPCKVEFSESGCDTPLVQFIDNTRVSDIFSASMKDHANSVNPPPPPPSPPIMALGLDLTLESITRYQTKPKNMYTFLCAQEFRRDEYSWHYKNVHSDIHGGLNGWLEHRCPLAHYGCMYSLRRFYPSSKGASVIHSDVLESFGVKPCVRNEYLESRPNAVLPYKKMTGDHVGGIEKTCSSELEDDENLAVVSEQLLELCQLPFEVLRHVCRFLDPFSLCNLALTCRRLREVCCSLLNERGIVVQQWRKNSISSKITWTIGYKRWFFSTAFTPIETWGFETKDHMSNHLKSCAFFERKPITKPYSHIFDWEPSPGLRAKLEACVPEDFSEIKDSAEM